MTVKIRGILPVSNGTLVVDEWVPFSFRAYQRVRSLPYYWLFGDRKTSLLEMRVDRQSGAVIGVTLTAFSKKKIGNELPVEYREARQLTGLPVVDTENFVGGRRDEPSDFDLVGGANWFVVMLKHGVSPRRCLHAGRTRFFEHDSELCAVGFFDLTEPELEILSRIWNSWE
jgi:hypothetical protein